MTDSAQSATRPFAIRCFEVEIASEPTTSATRSEPEAMRSQNSLTRVCGVSPSSMASHNTKTETPGASEIPSRTTLSPARH